MTPTQQHIIAMGGGGFSMEPENPLLDDYVLQHARKPDPTVCFVPTASGENDFYVRRFYTEFAKKMCRPRHLSVFDPPRDLAGFIRECDVLYVGGGNTRNLVVLWREWGLDRLFRQAWENGTVLCGVSAGAICWFEQGLTDSAGPLAPMSCLGYIPGSCTPHYDGESDRRPSYHRCILEGTLAPGYALEDGAAAHFIGGRLAHVVSSRPQAKAYHLSLEKGAILERPIPTRYLGTE
jgi:dipeptidase E